MKRKNPLTLFIGWIALAVVPGHASAAEPAAASATASGVIEGRVLNSRSGEYIENARLTIEGTALEAFTDANGFYRFAHVPPGTARIKVFYTGFPAQSAEVAVSAGRVAAHDISLSGTPSKAAGPDGDTVKLSKFVVEESREMDIAAVAINEQRFAPNIKNVVSTDDFGSVAESNVGEFLKFMPGITVDYNGGNAREISIDGVPSGNVPVTVGGFMLASTSVGTSRAPSLDFISVNNASRVEVSYSPTPESEGSALAGSVNVVPRSSFGRSRPQFKTSVYLTMRDNARDFNKTPGPRAKPTRKVHPGLDFSYIMPVNSRFGFAITGGTSTNYSNLALAQAQWRGVGAATNGAAFPHTTPDKPYLTTYTVRDGATNTTRNAFGFTVDYKFSAYDRVSLAYQWSSFESVLMNRLLTFNVNRVLPGGFSPTATQGAAGAGSIQISNDAGVDRLNRTYMPTLTWNHDGPVWKLEGGIGLSYSTNHIRGMDKGFFNLTQAQRTGVTVSFDNITYLRPGTITVTDGVTGAPVDPYRLSSYVLTSATGQRRNPIDLQQSVYGNARRDFDWRVPATLKAGFNVRQSVRDIRNHSSPYAYVGPDGRGSTTPAGSDDSAVPFFDESFSQRIPPYGFPPTQWVSPELVFEAYRANPNHFVLNATNEYNTDVNSSKRAEEIVSAAFLRGDAQFFDRRLKLVGGLRAEQTNVEAFGPLTDPTRNFQRDARGVPILGANGRPLPITTNTLDALKLTFVERGTRAEKEYLRWFPNLNASFNVRENLIARAAYYYSIGRPDLNQYAGGLSLPDTENLPSPGNRIAVNNVGIKAWTAKTTNVRFEYYFEGVGQVSVGAFRRDFENFFGGTVFSPTPEFLALYGLDPALYSAYDVSTQENVKGIVRMQGLNFSYKQALTFLPQWARGVQVFANGSTMQVSGGAGASFNDDFNRVPRSGSWGVSLTRERFNLRVNWNYRGRQQQGLVAASTSVGPETYNWTAKRYSYDILGEYNLTARLAAFATLRNVNDAPLRREIAGPSTPRQAQLNQLVEYGALWTFGLKGTF